MRSPKHALWAVVLLTTSLMASQADAACFKGYGDVNGDASVNVVDVACAALVGLWHYYGGPGDPMPGCTSAAHFADADCSGGCADMSVIPQAGAAKPITVVDIKILIVLSLELQLPSSLDSDQDGCPDACDPAVHDCDWVEPEEPEGPLTFPIIDNAKKNGLGTALGTDPESYGFDGLYGLFAGFAQDVRELATANSEVSDSEPACQSQGHAGRLWYDTAARELRICNGTDWQ